jgi:murein DD-endopeptidase MepM/ murein hydrolase activator NlpD
MATPKRRFTAQHSFFWNNIMLDYSHAGGEFSPSARRIVLICAFLAASTTAFALYRTESAPDANAATVAADSPSDEFPAEEFDSIVQGAVADAVAPPPASQWTKVEVKAGESLSNIFDQLHLPAEDWMSMAKLDGDAAHLRRLRAGDVLQLRIIGGRLEELTYAFDQLHTLTVRRGDSGMEASTLTAAIERRSTQTSGVIENSLFADGHKAGLNDRLILEFADLFGYDIDFAQDLQEGDRFSVVYEELYKDGKKMRDGDILAAEFINHGKKHRAVRFVAADGSKAYFSPDGQSLRTAFIRTPVDFARISSGFSLHRWHPILNIMRAHKGVDYAAAIGTPVHATGDAKVEFVGRKGGYGNVVMLQHNGNIETVYGHLSRFAAGLHIGARVRQGQVIAYVGMTGLATAPHLHYEFRVNGIHQNPVTVALPRAFPLDQRSLAQFKATATPLLARLDDADAHQFAKAGP